MFESEALGSEPRLFSGAYVPRENSDLVKANAPIGSLYLRRDVGIHEVWIKTEDNPEIWERLRVDREGTGPMEYVRVLYRDGDTINEEFEKALDAFLAQFGLERYADGFEFTAELRDIAYDKPKQSQD